MIQYNKRPAKRTKKYEPRRKRYGVEVKKGDILSLIKENEKIKQYCYKENEFVIHYARKCGRKQFNQLITGLSVIKTFCVERKGKLENIYPERDGWIHVGACNEIKANQEQEQKSADEMQKETQNIDFFTHHSEKLDIRKEFLKQNDKVNIDLVKSRVCHEKLDIRKEFMKQKVNMDLVKSRVRRGEKVDDIRKEFLKQNNPIYDLCVENHSALIRLQKQVEKDIIEIKVENDSP